MSTPAPYEAPDRGWMGDRSRGAGMGRASHDLTPGARVHLRRVVGSGDYDKGGAYWGSVSGHIAEQRVIGVTAQVIRWSPAPLYCAWDDFGGVQWIRAASRDEAKRELVLRVGEVRFYR